MSPFFDLQIHVNAQETFFLTEKIMVKYSEKLRKLIKQEKKRLRTHEDGIVIEIDDFPGGPYGFELVARFCYNQNKKSRGTLLLSDIIKVSNLSILHCCAEFLGMSEKMSSNNLLHQTEIFLETICYWSWNDILTCLKNTEFESFHESCCDSLQQRLMFAVLAKIAENNYNNNSNSDISQSTTTTTTSSSTCSSSSSCSWSWWFDDLSLLSPKMIQLFLKTSGCYGIENTSLVQTKFLLHYLKGKWKKGENSKYMFMYTGLADTAIHGVIYNLNEKKQVFSCRGLFWVLRVVSGFGPSKECRKGLEKLIAGMLDQATLDDLIVSGTRSHDGVLYDVNLVVRLIRLFVHHDTILLSIQKLNKVGRLMEKYLREIAPDPNLKISKFLAVAESLPDCTRDCFDGIYRAIDIFLESHPTISTEERSRLCRCLNYEKLSLEACKDLAKNPRIPPRIAVQALAAQYCSSYADDYDDYDDEEEEEPQKQKQKKQQQQKQQKLQKNHSSKNSKQIILYNHNKSICSAGEEEGEEDEYMKLNIQKMQWRVVELEKVCQEMKGQISRMVKGKVLIGPPHHVHGRNFPRMC